MNLRRLFPSRFALFVHSFRAMSAAYYQCQWWKWSIDITLLVGPHTPHVTHCRAGSFVVRFGFVSGAYLQLFQADRFNFVLFCFDVLGPAAMCTVRALTSSRIIGYTLGMDGMPTANRTLITISSMLLDQKTFTDRQCMRICVYLP